MCEVLSYLFFKPDYWSTHNEKRAPSYEPAYLKSANVSAAVGVWTSAAAGGSDKCSVSSSHPKKAKFDTRGGRAQGRE